MLLTDALIHTASIPIAAKPSALFGYVSDGRRLGEWAFGSWNTRLFKDDVYIGQSLFDGKELYIRVKPYPPMLQIDFEVGRAPDQLLPRITARILPPELVGISEEHSLFSIISWRTKDIPDERWRLTCAAHEAEVFRLRHAFSVAGNAPYADTLRPAEESK